MSKLEARGITLALLCAALLAAAGCGGGGGGSGGPGSNSVQVLGLNPNFGPFVGGQVLTVHGHHFQPVGGGASSVTLGGNACSGVVTLDDDTLTCLTPAGTPGAIVDVKVTNSNGQGTLVHGYRYLTPIPPRSDVNGDGIADLVIGDPGDDTNGLESGAVYIFFGSRNPGDLIDQSTAQADVKILGHSAGDHFGLTVCTGDLNGDHIDDLVVGADGVDAIGASGAGMVYVFYGPFAQGSTLWAQGAPVKLSGETTAAGDRFGSLVAIEDVTGDHGPDVIVAAPRHDRNMGAGVPSSLDAGCLYVFKGGSNLVSKGAAQAEFKFDGEFSNQRIGDSIACADLNHDGVEDLCLGAKGGDPALPPELQIRGRVYTLFGGAALHSMGVESSTAVFTGEELDDQFGASAGCGDVNGDGIPDLVVGAPMNNYYGADYGRVFVFLGGAGFAGRNASLADARISGLYNNESIGTSLFVGDANGDFIDDLLIGAPEADTFELGNGRVYAFRGGPALGDVVATDATNTYDGEIFAADHLGAALALVDLNGDGVADTVCSSTYHNGGSGRVYVFFGGHRDGDYPGQYADVKYSGAQLLQGLGAAIARGQ